MDDLDEPVHIIDYRAQWATEAVAEAARIAKAIGRPLADLEHIGSTAVVGLAAKPIVDLMLGVPEYPAPSMRSALTALGYEDLGEAGVPERTYFRLRGHASFNVHLVLKGGAHWQHNIALRNYLRSSPTARQRYTEAKQAALSSGQTNLLAYSAAKGAVIADLLREALAANTC
ncbi:MAG: GrpB family protein [Verrucomicrobia bacterium]|nr:MAG: GrpB family protein [Verrucomicrobiota bacterium]